MTDKQCELLCSLCTESCPAEQLMTKLLPGHYNHIDCPMVLSLSTSEPQKCCLQKLLIDGELPDLIDLMSD